MFNLYLKSVEIQGFKSFPEKTRLTFEKPITGVVGPNGSGKSNISDAILWAMGEQSTRSLRGGRMEDVIFGGTQRRSQVGFAEVSLILDNSEEKLGLANSEVMITRRYYRSGESEYYINRTLVRLRDVNELLMDTGLGREGYSTIGQGKIADILSTKNKDRREIFEEAAGISRHRHKKEEAERKLQQTDENLVRIGDKISELEMQVEPLREQAEIARKFLLLRDELRGLEISVWLRELETLRLRAEKADADHAGAKIGLETATREFDSGFEEAEKLSDDMRSCDIEADSVRDLISSEEAQLSELESSVAVLKSQMDGNVVQIERLNLDIESQVNRQDGVGAQISEREERLSEISAAKTQLNERESVLIAEHEGISASAGEKAEEIGTLLKDEDNLKSGLADNKAKLSALASQAQELYDVENSVRLKLAFATDSLGIYAREHKECEEELSKTKEEAVSIGNVVGGLTIKANNRTEKAEKTGGQLDKLTLEIKTLQSRRNLLSDLEKDFQGYSKAVKMVMQELSRGTLKNIHGTVAGLIKTGDKYTAAIETALGGAMQNIIVDTEEDGKAAINLLKRADGGRATFLPISTIRGNVLSEKEVGGDKGFEGVAYNLVEFDPRYSDIYASLLGRVIIADNLNSAVSIARTHKHRYRVVTLDGQVINAGGSMTGGSTASSSGILSRANEIAQLATRLESLSADAAKLQKEHAECVREKNSAEYELDVARSELRVIEDKLIRLESEELHRSMIFQSAKDEIASLENELESLGKRIQSNTADTVSIKELVSEHETQAESLKERIENVMQGQDLLAQERERVNAALSELRAQRASLDAEYDALSKAVLELSALREEMSGTRDRQLEAIDELKNRNTDILKQIHDYELASSSVEKQITQYKERIAGLNAQKLDIEAKRSALNKEIQDKNQEMLQLERECSRLEQKKLAAQMEEKQIVDKLWDNYELSRTAALSAAQPIESLAAAQRSISSIKRQISELGTPNIGAIDEYVRVNTRFTFLTTQRDDVIKAKEELKGIIGEITEHMRDIFLREFSVINKSFEKTFRELFGGGNANLILEDPEDVLNCGIEIQVQPPGKSLKTLTLLSGGEKAFVAIAIYFAILEVRPPPFVVMDEIDAALDDANVLRFASYMRRMSNNSQMIVISHKRATMEEADILYGVTMQELGVSTILKVDLDEAIKN